MLPTSIPEKTLEHWISIYLTYRYRSHAGLWWPAVGEDIRVEHLPSRPGKTILLEIKTAYVDRKVKGRHAVRIDRSQLKRYLQYPLYAQPFYVIVDPYWKGQFLMWCQANGLDPTESAFRRSLVHGRKWFADWLLVLTAREVDRLIDKQASDPQLLRVDNKARHSRLWGAQSLVDKQVVYYSFQDFWKLVQQCGKKKWGQILTLPEVPNDKDQLTRPEACEIIRNFKEGRNESGKLEVPKANVWGWNGENYQRLESDDRLFRAEDFGKYSFSGFHLGIEVLSPL